MTSSQNILEFLDNQNISWFPIDLKVQKNAKGKYDKVLHYTKNHSNSSKNYQPKPTDFNKYDEEIIKERQQIINDYDYIAIDTRTTNMIDVDTQEHQEVVKNLKNNTPYFLSVSKQLPHLFVTFKDEIKLNRIQSIHEDIEVLTGQWSYCHKNAIVENCNDPIMCINNDEFLENKTKKITPKEPKEQKEQKNPKESKEPGELIDESSKINYDINYSNIDMSELLQNIDIKYCDDHDPWMRICAILINCGYKLEDFDKFSKRSQKYDASEVKKMWEQLVEKPLSRLTYASLHRYLQESTSENAKQYLSKLQPTLKTTEQVNQMSCLFKLGHLSHKSMAYIFHQGNQLLFQYSNKFWYKLTPGGIYNKLVSDSCVIVMKSMSDYMQNFFLDMLKTTIDNEEKTKKIYNALGKVECNSFKTACLSECKQFFIDEDLHENFNKKPHLVGFKNGVYNLKTRSFNTGTIDDNVSITTRHNYEEFVDEYVYFDNFINSLFDCPAVARWFKKHLGSFLEGGNREEKGYFWLGSGRNGKGTINLLLELVLGEYYHSLPIEYYTTKKKSAGGPEPEKMAIQDKRICMTHETEGNDKFISSTFKSSTGNDPITTRGHYGDMVTFNPTHKSVIQSNNFPQFTDVDDGVKTRIIAINFPNKFCEEKDYNPLNPNHKPININLKSELKNKGPGFMNYLVHWHEVYSAEGLQDLPEKISAYTDSKKLESDTIKSFIEEALIKTDNDKDRLTTSQLLIFHNQFYTESVLTSQTFAKRLNANNITVKRVITADKQRGMGICGYKMNPDFLDDIGHDVQESQFEAEYD
jgi:P4 family phage/plasmid primase-like protien